MKSKKFFAGLTAFAIGLTMTISASATDYADNNLPLDSDGYYYVTADDTFTVNNDVTIDMELLNENIININKSLTITGDLTELSNNATINIYKGGKLSSSMITNYEDAVINIYYGGIIELTGDEEFSNFGVINNYTGYDISSMILNGENGIINNYSSFTQDDSQSGNANVKLDTNTISQPTYTVTIPIKVDFETLLKTSESNIVSKPCTVTANNVSNLFENQKKLVVTVASENNFKLKNDGTTTIAYSYYLDDQNTALGADKTVLTVNGTATNDKDLTKTASNVISVDTKNITKAGSFTDVLTFTVALADI